MKSMNITALVMMVMVLVSAAVAAQLTPEDRGKALFNDTKLGNGTSGRSCGTCHHGGKGLEGTGDKKVWNTPGGDFTTIEETVNICIKMALKGTALDVNSEQMKDLVSYVKTIKVNEEKPVKKKRRITGC